MRSSASNKQNWPRDPQALDDVNGNGVAWQERVNILVEERMRAERLREDLEKSPVVV